MHFFRARENGDVQKPGQVFRRVPQSICTLTLDVQGSAIFQTSRFFDRAVSAGSEFGSPGCDAKPFLRCDEQNVLHRGRKPLTGRSL